MTTHPEWTDRLSAYLDDELPPAERDAVGAHLAACPDCGRVLSELQAVVAAAQHLEPRSPDTDLWAGIADRLATPDGGARSTTKWSRRFSLSALELIAAGLALAILSGWLATRALSPAGRSGQAAIPNATGPSSRPETPPVEPAVDSTRSTGTANAALALDDAEYDLARRDLEHTLTIKRDRLDPATVAVVEDNLAIIDRALSEARRALAADPSNGYLSGYVVETRQRQLDMLRHAAAMTNGLD